MHILLAFGVIAGLIAFAFGAGAARVFVSIVLGVMALAATALVVTVVTMVTQ